MAIDICKAFDRVWHAGLIHNFKSYGISGQIFGLILFLVIDRFQWFLIENLHKNIQLMLDFLKSPFLLLHFSCYTLMIFLTMLSLILLSLLMALLFILSVTRHLIYGNNLNWLLNLNDDGSIDVKMDGSALEEKSSFEMLGLTFYSKLDWGSYIISIGKTGRISEL